MRALKYSRLIYSRSCHNTPSKPSSVSDDALKAFGIGNIAGALGSLCGMGGSFVAIPLMTQILKITQHQASSTSMVAVFFVSLGGGLSYYYDYTSNNREKQSKHVDLYTSVSIACTGSIFSVVGANLSKLVPNNYLKIAMGINLLVNSILVQIKDFARSYKKDTQLSETGLIMPIASNHNADNFTQYIKPVAIGVVAGTQAGFFGVGGGAVIVPALVLFTDLDYKTALGTSLFSMIPTSITGSIAHYRNGNMLVRLALPLGVGCFIGSSLGGQVSRGIDDTTLKNGFSMLMILLGIKTLRSIR